MITSLLAALAFTSPAHADDAWQRVRSFWSAEVGASFDFTGDLTGNVRDIPRAYSEGEVAGNLPLGGGLFLRSIARYPTGKRVDPALLTRVAWSKESSAGTFDGTDYTRDLDRVELLVGPGACVDKRTCLFATYGYRQLSSRDVNYPITNLEAVLGEGDQFDVEGFTPPFLGAIIDPGLVDLLLSTVDFSQQKVTIDTADRFTMHGGQLALVVGAGEQITVDGAVGYYVARQAHDTTANVQLLDREPPDDKRSFAYSWAKDTGFLGIDLGGSIGVLPPSKPVQLAIGIRGSVWQIIDLSPDRSVGGYLKASAFVSTKW